MKNFGKKHLAAALIMFAAIFSANGQGNTGQPLNSLQVAKPKVGTENSRARQMGMTGPDGKQKYVAAPDVLVNPLPYTPSTTGNTTNLARFVERNDTVWYIDWEGDAKRLSRGGGGGSPDQDWLKIRNNQVPYAITDSIYTDNIVSINGRNYFPDVELNIYDSVSTGGSTGAVIGNRGGRWAAYNTLTGTWSSWGQEGSIAQVYAGNGTTHFSVSEVSGISPGNPTGTFDQHFELDLINNTAKFNKYPNSRNDAGVPVNVLTTSSTGVVESHPIGEIFVPDSTYKIPNTSAFSVLAYMSRVQTGRVVETDGFYTAGDGGGARYLISATGTADGIAVFSVSGGRFATVLANADGGISPDQLGAKINDAVDDKAFFQKAIDLFPLVYSSRSGFYQLGGRLKITSGKAIILGEKTEVRLVGINDVMLYTDYRTPNANITVKGGIWNRNATVGAPSASVTADIFSGALLDYTFLLANTVNLEVGNLSMINSPKFCLSNGKFKNSYLHDIVFNTLSDGIHAMGPGSDIVIENISGKTGDDFIAVSGSDYTVNAYSEGDISGIKINGVFADSTSGNMIALFPGNNGTRNLVFKDVTIQNVSGHTLSNPVIAITQYGAVGDPATGKTTGGKFGAVSISNIYATSGSGSIITVATDTIDILNVSDISVEHNDAITFNGSASIASGYVVTANFSNIYFSGVKLATNCFNFSGNVKVDNLNLSGISAKTGSVSALFFNATSSKVLKNVSISNSVFDATVANTGRMVFGTDSMNLRLKNIVFSGCYTPVNVTGKGYNIWVNDVDFGGATTGVSLLSATSTATVFPTSYKFGGADYNAFRGETAGSVCTIYAKNAVTERHLRLLSDYSIPVFFAIGAEFTITNIHPTSTITIFRAGSDLINGATSYPLLAGQQGTFRKISATDWEAISSSSAASSLPSGTLGQTVYNNGSGSYTASSNLYHDGTNVGVGITTPLNQKLTVNGSIGATTGLFKTSTGESFLGLSGTIANLLGGWSIGNISRLDIGAGSAFPSWYRSTGNIGLNVVPNASDKLAVTGGIYSDGDSYGVFVDAGGNYRLGITKLAGNIPVFAHGNTSAMVFGEKNQADARGGTFTGQVSIPVGGGLYVGPGIGGAAADGVVNAATGYRVNGAAANGSILSGNGTNGVFQTPAALGLVTTLAAVGSTPNANAGTISGSTLNLQPANATNPGVVTATTQTFSGQKTIAMASGGAVTQNLILDNTATAAVSSATSMAHSVTGVQRGEVRTTLTEIVGGGADFAKIEIKAQNGGALKTAILADMKDAGVDIVEIIPGDDGALKSARRSVQPYSTTAPTGNFTITAGYNFNYIDCTGLPTGVATTVTMPANADMIDGEIYTIYAYFPTAPSVGTLVQLSFASGQTYEGTAGPLTTGLFSANGSNKTGSIKLQYITGGLWRRMP